MIVRACSRTSTAKAPTPCAGNLDTGEARIDNRPVPDFDYHHDLPAGDAEFEIQGAQHWPHPP